MCSWDDLKNIAIGYYFNAAGYAQVDAPGIAMGANCLDCTIQLATDIDYSIQPVGANRWPNLFAFPNDFALSRTRMTWGGSANTPSQRYSYGTFHAVRLYNRVLTEEELAQNDKVDDIRYRGAFPDYCNIEVSCEQPFEGAEATSSVADGSYEVVGAWTFTASDYEYEQPLANSDQTVTKTLRPHYMISYLQGNEWTRLKYHEGNSYTYTAGSAPVKLVWSWTPRAGTLLIIR